MPAQKIATCCYCGTRAALVLRGKDRHELSCSSCGAPLHDLKMLPKAASRGTAPAATPTRPRPKPTHPKQPHPKARKVKKRNKRKGIWRKIVEEVWDEIEDIFD
ncbi:hypothetical protein L0664_03725 [Octadecabacter sp. G9-8]|uniref:TFIIB-type zinc ribbon-containing protein n=1 Tax=Octadecabacter dasysiphoniae TaxID=2909341 RepID=A0ABS9CVG3_9RHOB|nr:hypothetical protein [Octadecabacter dasysiphoniae]MCF2870166.1 hypothetical protein [Octadecabacter dasysiphoniae]